MAKILDVVLPLAVGAGMFALFMVMMPPPGPPVPPPPGEARMEILSMVGS